MPGVEGGFVLADVLSSEECKELLTATEEMGTWAAAWWVGCHKGPHGPRHAWRGGRLRAGGRAELRGVQGAADGHGRDGNLGGSLVGYRPDVPISSQLDERAHNVVLMANDVQNQSLPPGLDAVPETFGRRVAREPIRPRVGSASVFPHGDCKIPLLHEGSAVTKGTKHLELQVLCRFLPMLLDQLEMNWQLTALNIQEREVGP
eukprot:Skav226483  [mRNA]  locus=scaffold4441:125233:128540:- [translate_table: standard]